MINLRNRGIKRRPNASQHDIQRVVQRPRHAEVESVQAEHRRDVDDPVAQNSLGPVCPVPLTVRGTAAAPLATSTTSWPYSSSPAGGEASSATSFARVVASMAYITAMACWWSRSTLRGVASMAYRGRKVRGFYASIAAMACWWGRSMLEATVAPARSARVQVRRAPV